MGGHAYWYFTIYNPNITAALDLLREREFEAGRYNPAMPFIEFPVDVAMPSPGAQHTSPLEALEDAQEDGTRSILDIQSIGDAPDFCTAGPFDEQTLKQLFGTTQPTHAMVDSNLGELLEPIERGQAVYIIVYKNGKPDELFFAGYSFD